MRTAFFSAFTLILLCPCSSVFSQDAAQKHITLATEQIKTQNYIAAYEELDKARNETMKLVSAQLEKVFPATVNNWTQVKDPMGMMPTMPGRNISINKSYELVKEPAKAQQDSMAAPMNYMQPRMMVTISNDTFSMNNILAQYANATAPKDTMGTRTNPNTPGTPAPMPAMGAMPGEEVKAVTIKNFKAVSRLNTQMKITSLSIVTGKSTVQIHGMQIETTEPLLKLAEAIDLNKIAEVFGKK